MKRLFALFLSVFMILSVFTVSVFAAECDHNSLTDGGTIVVEPTCSSTGLRKVHCDVCDKDIYFNIERIEHRWYWTVSVYPTVNSTGLKDGRCSNCGETMKGVVMPKVECSVHSADLTWEETADWEIIYDSTCLDIGKEQAWCTGCNKYIVRDIPIKNHYKTVFPQIDPNCEEYGETESVYCFSCRSYIDYPEILPAIGHDPYVLPDVSEPTCKKEGEGHIYCAREGCDYSEKTEIAKLVHNDADGDQYCDMCGIRMCRCICHMDHFIARFVRKFNTLLNKLLNGGEMVFCCCECMEPLE